MTNPQIALYATYTHELLGTLRGHTGLIRAVSWAADETFLVSAGLDGAVYQVDY